MWQEARGKAKRWRDGILCPGRAVEMLGRRSREPRDSQDSGQARRHILGLSSGKREERGGEERGRGGRRLLYDDE